MDTRYLYRLGSYKINARGASAMHKTRMAGSLIITQVQSQELMRIVLLNVVITTNTISMLEPIVLI